MNRQAAAALELALVSLLSSCSGSSLARPSETVAQPEVAADTFFSGCAYLDENGNGAIDPAEPLLGDVRFTVTLASGAGFGGQTSEGQCALLTVPVALPPNAWPIVARMVEPEGAAYKPIGPTEVTLQYPGTGADFLFTAK